MPTPKAQPRAYISSNLVRSGDTFYWMEADKEYGGGNGLLRSMSVTGGPVTDRSLDIPHADSEFAGPFRVQELAIDSANLYAVDDAASLWPAQLATCAGLQWTAPCCSGHQRQDRNLSPATAATVRQQLDALLGRGGSDSFNIEGDLISGGNRRTFGSSQNSSCGGERGLTTDGERVYWASGDTLLRRVYDASTAQETIASARVPKTAIGAFAVNTTTAYFTSAPVRTDRIIPDPFPLDKAVFGGKTQGVAYADTSRSLVLDERSVYWTSPGQIWRADL